MGPRGLYKAVISMVIIGVTPFKGTKNSTYNLLTKSPGPLSKDLGFRVQNFGFRV